MAKGSGMIIALAAGAGLLLLASGSKAKAAAQPTPALPKPTQKPPPLQVNADDERPNAEEVPLDILTTDMPVAIAPVQDETPAEMPGPLPDASPAQSFSFASRPVGGGVWRVTNEDGSPVRPVPAEAKRLAQGVADNIRTKGTAYDRARLSVWQALAGLRSVDGVYGPESQGALTKMGAKSVPRPLFRGAN